MYSDGLNEFLKFLRMCELDYQIAQSEMDETNDETQDILHKLELEDIPYHTKAKLAKALTEVRKKRRKAKSAMIELEPIINFKTVNAQTVKNLEKVLGDVKKLELKNKNCSYHPKTTIVHDTLERRN